MAPRRKYRYPPIVEALCELYFEGSEWDDTVPGQFYDQIKIDFPVKRQREIQEAQVMFSTAGEASAGVKRLPPWMQFVTSDESRLIQIGQDVLVINQLRPYPHFEEWEPLIYSSLETYRKVANPKGIARLGLRYINRVVIPHTQILMEDYFTVYPQLPKAMGEMHGRFMIRVDLPSQQGGHGVLITFGSAPAEKPNEVAHLLDLYDIFKPEHPLGFDSIKDQVAIAHKNIEAAFEGSITDKLRNLFDLESL
ncbi:MAG: TIGR04255 family protein [Nitrospira sp.]|nr:TIGR04255 family protein [Nitrospira sp.]